jgi:phenylacetate-CoA ligase
MRVWVETAHIASEDSRATQGRTLQKRIKQMLGITVAVHVGQPGEVTRSQGKAVRIIDNRPKQ